MQTFFAEVCTRMLETICLLNSRLRKLLVRLNGRVVERHWQGTQGKNAGRMLNQAQAWHGGIQPQKARKALKVTHKG